MSTYRVIRVAEDYGVVVVVSPEDVDPYDTEAQFYLHNDNIVSTPFFAEVSRSNAIGYFGGCADGLGWGVLPKNLFTSLADIETWAKNAARRFYRKTIASLKKQKKKKPKSALLKKEGE